MTFPLYINDQDYYILTFAQSTAVASSLHPGSGITCMKLICGRSSRYLVVVAASQLPNQVSSLRNSVGSHFPHAQVSEGPNKWQHLCAFNAVPCSTLQLLLKFITYCTRSEATTCNFDGNLSWLCDDKRAARVHEVLVNSFKSRHSAAGKNARIVRHLTRRAAGIHH